MDRSTLVLPFSFILCLSFLTPCLAEKGPARFRISIIQVKTEAEAELVLKKLDSGEDFAEVCGEHSIGPGREKGGDIGYFAPGELSEPLNSEAVSLKAGQYSHVIETQGGYFILKKTDVESDSDITGNVQTGNYQYWYGLASEHTRAGEYEEAVEASKRAISLNPYFAEAYFNLGLAYSGLGMYEEAMEASEQAIGLKPDFVEAYINLGLAYSGLGMYKEAMEASKQAISLNPYSPEAHYNLGFAYNGLGMHREAVEASKRAVSLNPYFAEAHYNLGLAYSGLGMYEEAVEASKKAISLSPYFAEAYINLGFAYNGLGMYREAIEAYKQAIKIRPDLAEIYINLGFAYNGLGMYEDAIEASKKAISLNPDSVEAHYNLGFAYFHADDRGSALEEYERLKDLNSKYADELYILISREEAAKESDVQGPFAIRDKMFESECIRDCDIEVEIFKAEGESYEFRGKTLVVCKNKMTPFCYGARHTWVGRLNFGGYTFDSDKDDPLQFMVTRDKGYVYIKGKGTVTMPDGTTVLLPQKGQ